MQIILEGNTFMRTQSQNNNNNKHHYKPELFPFSVHHLLLFRLLRQVTDKALLIIGHNLSDVNLPKDEKDKRTKLTLEKYTSLKDEVNVFFKEEINHIWKQLDVISDKLSKYLRQRVIINKICKIEESEIPHDKLWGEVTVMVRSLLYDKMGDEINNWEAKEHHFEKLGLETSQRFQQKFPDFDLKLHHIEQRCRSNSLDDSSTMLGVEQVPFVPLNITRKFDSLNLGFKVLIGVAFSPVFLVGAIVRLPVWGIQELKRKFDSVILEKDYGADRAKAIRKYAEITLQGTTDPYKMKPIIEEQIKPLIQYLDQQRLKVVSLIDADIAIIDKKREDLRRRESIVNAYSGLKQSFENHNNRILYFYKMRLPLSDPFVDVSSFIVCEKISGGITQELHRGRMIDGATSGFTDVTVRKSRLDITVDNIRSYLKEEETYW